MSLDGAFCRFGVAHQLLEMRLDVISGAAGGLVRSSFVLEDAEGHTGSLARIQPIIATKPGVSRTGCITPVLTW